MTLLEAIAAFEGFGASPNNRPTRNNNPGNLTYGPFARNHGGTLELIPPGFTSKPRFAYFESVEQGWRALGALMLSKYAKHTIEEMILKYAPPFENDTEMYIQYIVEKVGCSRNTLVELLL
jgi:hypothetical protein